MTQDCYKEIEMQTYSMSHSYSVKYPTDFPCQWDEDILPEMDQEADFFDIYGPKYIDAGFHEPINYEAMEDLPPIGVNEKNSEVSESNNTSSTDISNKSEVPNIYKKLDFILDSVRKLKKPIAKKPLSDKGKKQIRKRKTTAQLNLLKSEVGDIENMSKEKINELAEKTGLTTGQVYKWIRDYKKRSEIGRAMGREVGYGQVWSLGVCCT